MPLDRAKGEVIQGMGHNYVVVDTDKWATTSFGAPHFLDAHKQATLKFKKIANKFANDGERIKLSRDEVLVQEYHALNKVAYIFCHKIGGQEYYYPVVYDIDPVLVEELRLTGKWPTALILH